MRCSEPAARRVAARARLPTAGPATCHTLPVTELVLASDGVLALGFPGEQGAVGEAWRPGLPPHTHRCQAYKRKASP